MSICYIYKEQIENNLPLLRFIFILLLHVTFQKTISRSGNKLLSLNYISIHWFIVEYMLNSLSLSFSGPKNSRFKLLRFFFVNLEH